MPQKENDEFGDPGFGCDDISWKEVKKGFIEAALREPCDLQRLRELSVSKGGLIDDELRKEVWPRFVNVRGKSDEALPSEDEVQSHCYYDQVVLDVQRILKRFPPGLDEDTQSDLQVKVTFLIIRVLISHPKLHYYQGFHDVAITLLLVLGEDLSYPVLCKLAETHFSVYMGPNMEPSMELLSLVYILVRRLNPDLYDCLIESELGTMFCLPWVITWFGHVLNEYETVARLYDAFVAGPPETAIYLSAVIVLRRAEEIFRLPREMPFIHQLLSKDLESLPFDALILETWKLMETFPPDVTVKAAKELHAENLRRAKREEEERRKFYAAKKKKVPKRKRWSIAAYSPLSTPAGRLLAVSISIATLAWVYSYVKPTLYEF